MMKTHMIRDVLLVCVLFSSQLSTVFAEDSKWIVRARGIAVVPVDSSENIGLFPGAGATGITLAGSGVAVDEAYVPELDVTYMLTRRLGIEVIAGMSNHDVTLKGPGPVLSSLGLPEGFGLFDTWALPPTVTLQFHFNPDGKFRPYIGGGGNFTTFLWDEATSELEAAIGPVDVDTSNSWGWAAQAGFDIDVTDESFANYDWFINFDVKYIKIDTTASLHTALGTLRVDVDVDPLVFGFGIGLRF